MEREECPPVVVEGDWEPSASRTVRNKLHIYFQSRKKSGGGECRVEVDDGARRAAVFFQSQEVRERVVTRDDHHLTLGNQTIKLKLVPTGSVSNDDVSAAAAAAAAAPDDPPPTASTAANSPTCHQSLTPVVSADSESTQTSSVLLDNVPADMRQEMLLMLVETVSGFDESRFSLEMIRESGRAVVVFNQPQDVEKFMDVSQRSEKMRKYGLMAQPLAAARSVQVEGDLTRVSSVSELLDLYFSKNWAPPENIVTVPHQQIAIVSFSDSKVVDSICIKEDYMIAKVPVKMYPYHEFLGTALYGKNRPDWKMPEAFTEKVDQTIWAYLKKNNLLEVIGLQMHYHFCGVDFETPLVKLHPLSSLMRQKLTAVDVDSWRSKVQEAFMTLMSAYAVFTCTINAAAWESAEEEIRRVVGDKAVMTVDEDNQRLMVACKADDLTLMQTDVDFIVHRTMDRVNREVNGTSDSVTLSPAMFYVHQQAGLHAITVNISPQMKLSYNDQLQELTISGLSSEVNQVKAWIRERNVTMIRKPIIIHRRLLDFLKSEDPMDLSYDLFTTQGISAIYSIDRKGVLLLGSSDAAVTDAETRLNTVMSVETLDVEDKRVLNNPSWSDLMQKLLETYNTEKKKTVDVQVDFQKKVKVVVVGFVIPVKEVSRSLKDFLVDNAVVHDIIRVKSRAVIQFMEKKKINSELIRIAKDNNVFVKLEPEQRRVSFRGVRTNVHKAKPCFEQLINSLCTDNLTVAKPGAKKYFQSQGSLLLNQWMSDSNWAVVVRPDHSEDLEEEEETSEDEGESVYCTVKTTRGVLITVSKGDICRTRTDAVVNAANEDLQHIGGLALALLNAAGQRLQALSDDYIAKNGRLRPGDAVITGAADLPCKVVVHAVGPRYSSADKVTSVALLKLAVQESLRQAESVNCSTIALPAISSGVFGFPLELCAQTIAKTLREFCEGQRGPRSLTEIHLMDINRNTVSVLAKAVNKEFLDLGPALTLPPQGGRRSKAAKSEQPGKKSQRGLGKPGPDAGVLEAENSLINKPYTSPETEQRTVGRGGSGTVEQTTAENLRVVLRVGTIQEQVTDVIVNTISDNMNLKQGAISSGILQGAGPQIQLAVRSEANAALLQFGDVIVTDGFNLACQKVFHTVCPSWSRGSEQILADIVRRCLGKAEDCKMGSLSFPAIGTGLLGFPREVVSRIFQKEIHSFSSRNSLQYLRQVVIVVHPSDPQTLECFTRGLKGQTSQHREEQEFRPHSPQSWKPVTQSEPPTATISQVSSPALGVYELQMGRLTLRVSSGDITKETSDVIVNSSNKDFNLKQGVSKAILEGAGTTVEQECFQIVNNPGYQPQMMIMTSAGLLPSHGIVHIIGQKEPDNIRELVFNVLTLCEERKFRSVSFPALGTGQGGASPSAVADAMVKAVEDFVKKKQPKSVHSVRFVVFQTNMLTEFHSSITRRAGEPVKKSILSKCKDTITSFFYGEERSKPKHLALQTEEFEPIVFQLCAQSQKDLSLAKKKIEDLILAEQAERTITDPYIGQFTQADMDKLKSLQRELTVSIRLESGREGQEPNIRLQGLTRDVLSADSVVRDIIRKVEREENLKNRARMLAALVEWQFPDATGTMVPFDSFTNLALEDALVKNQEVKIKIHNKPFKADAFQGRAVSADGKMKVELLRKELKVQNLDAVPAHWANMKGDIVRMFPLTAGSAEYAEVEKEFRKTGLTSTIVNIKRVQNATLWQNYQIQKKKLEMKNQHTNNEMRLFHGTDAKAIDFINNRGFDRSHAGQHGAMYGKGCYFAVNPTYSQNYAKVDANNQRHMYLARVLVGDHTPGNGSLITPPSKSSSVPTDIYDSVTDNASHPTIFVIFNDIQAYPEYIITFQ